MAILCGLGLHRVGERQVRNHGLTFGSCRRCGCDLIHAAGRWSPVPKGFRVVWRPVAVSAGVQLQAETCSRGDRREIAVRGRIGVVELLRMLPYALKMIWWRRGECRRLRIQQARLAASARPILLLAPPSAVPENRRRRVRRRFAQAA